MSSRKHDAPGPKPESLDYPFKYAGKNWVLRFSTRAFSRLKDHWGFVSDPIGTADRKTGDQKLGERMEFAEVEDIPIMLWAAMRSNHPDVTIEDVEEMVDEYGAAPLQPVLARILAAAMPPADTAQKKTTPSR